MKCKQNTIAVAAVVAAIETAAADVVHPKRSWMIIIII